jgi:hypothetical protein
MVGERLACRGELGVASIPLPHLDTVRRLVDAEVRPGGFQRGYEQTFQPGGIFVKFDVPKQFGQEAQLSAGPQDNQIANQGRGPFGAFGRSLIPIELSGDSGASRVLGSIDFQASSRTTMNPMAAGMTVAVE